MKTLLFLLLPTLAFGASIGSVDQGRGLIDGGTWAVTCTNCGGTGGGAGATGLTNAELRAAAVATEAHVVFDGGPVSVGNLDVLLSTRTKPSDQQHTIIDSSASIAVTGPLTDAQLRATAVPISGTVTTGGLTDTQLRAAVVPVSLASTTITGSVATTGPLTDAQLRATAVPVSGTVTANAGTNLNTSALALDATLTGRTQKAQVTDGTRDGTVKAASTLPLLTDTALVTTQRDPLPAGTNVIGHVIQDTGSTTAVTGNVTVVQPTGTNLHAVLDSTSTTAVTQATAANLNAAVVGTGTAGTPAGNLLTVQGVAGMTKLLVTPDSVALPANQSVNVAQMNGVATSMGTGVRGTGVQRVTIATDDVVPASQSGTWTVQPGNTANSTPWLTKIHDGTTAAVVKAASTAPVATDPSLVVVQSPNGGNPCQNPSATVVGLSGVTSGTSSVQLVALSGSTKIYICSMTITGVSGTTPTFKLNYGTGSACATGTVAMVGAWTTAANTVYTFAGVAGVGITPAGQALCYIQTGTTPVNNYNLVYVQI